MNADQNYKLLLGIDANRRFLLQAYLDNPDLLAHSEPEVRRLLDAGWKDLPDGKRGAVTPAPTFPKAAD